MILLYLSPNTWNSFAQRAHHCVQSLLSRADSVIWVDPYATRLPTWIDAKRPTNHSEKKPIPAGLSVIKVTSLPLEPFPGGSFLNQQAFWKSWKKNLLDSLPVDETIALGLGKPSQLGLDLLEYLKPKFSFYDAMDDFPQFYSGLSQRSMARRERELTSRVDRILVSSHALQSKFEKISNNVQLVPNACEFSCSPGRSNTSAPRTTKVIGYIGTISNWFDWELVIKIARSVQNIQIQLHGPVFSQPSQHLPNNVKIYPPCEHSKVPDILRNFDIGLIPFKRNQLTHSVDPVKYYEYRSMGLPVISTRFGEMTYHATNDTGIYFIDDSTDFSNLFNQALTHKDSEQDIIAFRSQNSWNQRFLPLANWLNSSS